MKIVFKYLTFIILGVCFYSCSSEKGNLETLLKKYLGAEDQKVEIIEYKVKNIMAQIKSSV